MYILCLLCVFMLPVYANNAAIIVMTPNGGENWLMGCPQTIQWITAAPMSVKIELFLNGTFYMTPPHPSGHQAAAWRAMGRYQRTPGSPCSARDRSQSLIPRPPAPRNCRRRCSAGIRYNPWLPTRLPRRGAGSPDCGTTCTGADSL